MLSFRRKKKKSPKYLKSNNKATAQNANSVALSKAKKNIYWQASLAGITVVLTIVIAFAMTSAWYTNIVQTSGLVFEAEAWGFEGTINVNSDPIVAAPGDDGVIHLEVENDSDSIVAVGINISKARMSPDMQQRLYFYVDKQMTRNDETVDRVYLNNQEGYNYTLFSNGKLTLTEDVYIDAQLKWQWVYDVLGYYVYGTEIRDEEGNGTGFISVTEYLRPIEYNYDAATTTFKTDENNVLSMVLQTVDGETTADEFLKELSKTDGYEGTINPEDKLSSGYYPVDVKEDVDGNHYGVYAYLCNYSEIERATQIDTAMGQAAASGGAVPKSEARLTISAQKNKNNVINVTSLASINAAMELKEVDVIQLSSNITIPSEESLVIAADQRVMLDLNGYTITSANAGTAIKVEEGGSLTMINGTLDGTEAKTANGIYAVGAEATLSNVKITGCTVGLRVADEEGRKSLDSKIHLLGSTIEATNYGIVVKGNGNKSEHLTQLIVENCTIISDSVGISGNGNSHQEGTDIQIINSTITGTAEDDNVTTGIFHPQANSKLTVYRSEISGYTGLAIKGGNVSVIGSTISGLGAKQAPAFHNSGCADTGDGIYIETNYEKDILLEISGGSIIKSAESFSLQVFKDDAPNVVIRIYDGTFDEEQPDKYIAEGSMKDGTEVKLKG